MDWANEPWRKLYVRETAEDAELSWQARFCWLELLKKVTAAGRVVLKRGAASLAALIRVPVEIAIAGLSDLLADGRLVEEGPGLYLMPNFEDAQRPRRRDPQGRFQKVTQEAPPESPSSEKRERATTNHRALFSLSSDPECPEEAQLVPAPSVDNSPEEDLPGADCLTLPQRQRLARHREAAARLWRLQASLREEVARHLGLSIAEVPISARALWPIVERLAESTPEQCEMALHYYASEARKKQTLQYFNGQTNWRPEHVQRACSLARLPAKSKPKPPPVVVRDEDRAPPEVMAAALEFAKAL